MTYFGRDNLLGKNIISNCLSVFGRSFRCSDNIKNSNVNPENIWNPAKNMFESGYKILPSVFYRLRAGLESKISNSLHKVAKPKTMVVLGGNAIWISKSLMGVMVGGLSAFKNANGNKVILQKDTGIKKGDIILKINDKSVNLIEDILKILSSHDGELIVAEIERNSEKMKLELAPAKRCEEGKYELGLKVFDFGLGHITFSNPETGVFGALGHPIFNEIGMKMRIKNAKIFEADVAGVEKGVRGRAGELLIESRGELLGEMHTNGINGIYGVITNENYFKNRELIPIASRKEIENGEAFILSTIKGKNIEKFSIEIKKTEFADPRHLVIDITDPRLVELAGGIVQGMSGSPIIQNGQLVGAVSHTFLRDPKLGFGVFAQAMLNESKWSFM